MEKFPEKRLILPAIAYFVNDEKKKKEKRFLILSPLKFQKGNPPSNEGKEKIRRNTHIVIYLPVSLSAMVFKPF